MNKLIIRLSSVIAGLTLFVVTAYAQVTTSSLGGRITDAQGPVAGAAVVAVHTPSGSQYYSVTGTDGNYRINGLTPGGPYTVTITMLGYRKVEANNLFTAIGETTLNDFTLEDESQSLDAVVITADAAESGMNISRAGAGTTVSARTKDMLPTTSRSLNDVMKLTPQASATSNGVAIGGGNYRQSFVTVDGAAFNNAFGIGGNLPSGGSPISLDAIEQMSINITPFDVRQSGFTGGSINAITKSGTNDWHVSVYDYYTSDQLEGDRIGTDMRAMSKTLNNTLGATIGGPIIKNKLFFFVNFEYKWDETAGSNKLARKSSDQNWGGSTSFNRPTEDQMNEILETLSSRYGYNPGRYQNYSLKTPDWKIMARIDWNINDKNKFNIRASHTADKNSNSPSSSISPLSNVYSRKTYGRTSNYAMYTESNRYYQEQNFTSVSAELNSQINEKISNTARVTWSHQNDPRSFEGGVFPTVDILQEITQDDIDKGGLDKSLLGTKAVLASFGPDPFTYGNLRDVHTITATDEVEFALDKHNVVAGINYEWNRTKNGFMQGGAGYYVYNSWQDFLDDKTPVAFLLTHANNYNLDQVYPSFDYHQLSIYAQDEWNASDNFKLTYGLRLEMPILPTIADNYNIDYSEKAATSASMAGTATNDMPKTTVNFSPRIGFNWDILKNRKLILRGGTGLYTGRIPFVWLVSVAGNSNCLQAQYVKDTKKDGTITVPSNLTFHNNVSDMINDIYGGEWDTNLPAPSGATILDKNLRMPTTWKTSLAIDGTIPGGIKASIEGIYGYNLNDVCVRQLGQVEKEGGIQLPGEPAPRKAWESENIQSKADDNGKTNTIAPYYITNATKNGQYYSVTASLKKDFNFGLSLMAAYTRSGSYVISDGLGDQVYSAYQTLTYNVNGSNVDEIGRSSYVSPNRFIFNLGYRINEGKGSTNIGLFYEGYNHCYVGDYDYSTYSYVMDNVTGDGGGANLIYIPTPEQLNNMTFTSDGKAEFENFIQNDSYLSKHRGEYMKRGAITAPWNSRFNLKISQDIYINSKSGKPHTITIGLDVNNIANLFNSEWGCVKQIDRDTILSYKNGVYTFTAPKWTKVNLPISAWQALVNLRYSF